MATWACSACTFLNDEDPLISSCIICNSPKPDVSQSTTTTTTAIVDNDATISTNNNNSEATSTSSVSNTNSNASILSSPLKCKILHALRVFGGNYYI